jgi:cytochrome oxidase Cu insertion factor (SCO1/SenC/PrrC family)
MLQPLSPRFIGMTGPSAQMKKIAAQFSGVFFKGLPNGPGGDYTVDHTSQIYLVDASGALRAMLFNPDVADIVSATKQLRTARG